MVIAAWMSTSSASDGPVGHPARNQLRQQSGVEDGDLGVEQVGGEARLPCPGLLRSWSVGIVLYPRRPALPQRSHTEIDQVSRAGELDDGVRLGRRGEDRRKPEDGQQTPHQKAPRRCRPLPGNRRICPRREQPASRRPCRARGPESVGRAQLWRRAERSACNKYEVGVGSIVGRWCRACEQRVARRCELHGHARKPASREPCSTELCTLWGNESLQVGGITLL